MIEVRVPNIGDFKDVPVIEVLVKPGDVVKPEDPLITVESEKASMEIPSPNAGKVESIAVKVGDKISEGSAILTLAGEGPQASPAPAPVATAPAPAETPAPPANGKPLPLRRKRLCRLHSTLRFPTSAILPTSP